MVSQVVEPDHQEEERRIEETMGRIEEEASDQNKKEMIKASIRHGFVPVTASPEDQTPLDSNDRPIK